MRKFIVRNKAGVFAVTAVFVALVSGLILASVGFLQARADRNEKTKALQERQVALTEAQQNESLAHHRLYAAQLNLAMQAWHGGETARVLELLESQRPGTDDEDLRGFEWYYLWRLRHQGFRPVMGHKAEINSIRYSPDGRTIASASGDRTVRLSDATTGKTTHLLSDPGGMYCYEVEFSPDGEIVVGAGKIKRPTCFWRVSTGELIRRCPESLQGIAFSPDGKKLYGSVVIPTKDNDGTPHVWDVKTGDKSKIDRLDAPGVVVGLSADAKSLGIVQRLFNPDAQICYFDLETGKRVLRISKPGGVQAWRTSPDRRRLAVGAAYLPPKIYDLESGQELFQLEGDNGMKYSRSFAFSPDGRRLAVGCEDRTVYVWDLETKSLLRKAAFSDAVWAVDFSPDGQNIAVGAFDGAITQWDMTPPKDAPSVRAPNLFGGELRFTPDGRSIVAAGCAEAAVLNSDTGQTIKILPCLDAKAVTRDGRRIFGPNGEHASIWDVSSGEVVAPLPLSIGAQHGAVFSPDSQLLALFEAYAPTPISLIDAATGASRKLPWRVRDHYFGALCAAFSPNGRYLAAGIEWEGIRLWDLKTGEPPRAIYPSGAKNSKCVRFSPNGSELAVGSDRGTVTFWNVETGEPVRSFRGGAENNTSMDFSPDGKTLAVGSDDMTVRLWDITSQQEKLSLKGHQSAISAVAFSPDGNTLATQSRDGILKLWKASTEPEARARRAAGRSTP